MRKKLASKKVDAMRQQLRQRDASIVKVQSFYRGSKSRADLKAQLRARYAANLAGEDSNNDEPDAENNNDETEEAVTTVDNVDQLETRDTTHRANRQLLQVDRKLDMGEEGYV